MKFLVLGSGGMAGHAVTFYLKKMGHSVYAHSRRKMRYTNFCFDLFDTKQLRQALSGKYDAVVNCSGLLEKACEENISSALYINSYLPQYIASFVQKSGTRFIHLSTDCVFSGSRGRYIESDVPDSKTMYGKTKMLGEVTSTNCMTIRTSIVGPDIDPAGLGLFNWFTAQTGPIQGYARCIWSGVTTIELAKAIEAASKSRASGVIHLCNNQAISKLSLLRLFKKHFNTSVEIIPDNNHFYDRSLRTARTDFVHNTPSFEAMVDEMAAWISENRQLYPHYL